MDSPFCAKHALSHSLESLRLLLLPVLQGRQRSLFDELLEESSLCSLSFVLFLLCFFSSVCYVHAHSTLISHSHVVRGVLLLRGLITFGVHFTPFPLHCRSHMKRKKTPSVEAIRAAIVNFYISIDFSKHSWRSGIMALKNGLRNTQKSNCLPLPLCITCERFSVGLPQLVSTVRQSSIRLSAP